MKNYLFHFNLDFISHKWFAIILLFTIPGFTSAQSCELKLKVTDIHCDGATGSISVELTTNEIGTFTLDWSGSNGASTIPSTTYVVTAGDIDSGTGLFQGDILTISGLDDGWYYLDVTTPGGGDCAAQAIINQTGLLDDPSCSGGDIFIATDPGLCTGTIDSDTFWEWDPNCNYHVLVSGDNSYTVGNVGFVVYDYREDFLGGSVQCTYQVHVYDLEPPNISCPPNVSATITDGTCSTLVFWNVTAVDNCGVYNISSTCFYPDGSQGPCASGDEYPFGTTTVVSTAQDYFGESHCSFSIIVNDASSGTLIFTGNIPDGVYHANQIISNGNVLGSGNVNFKAEQQVKLDQGFTVQPGGNFSGEIDDCSGN